MENPTAWLEGQLILAGWPIGLGTWSSTAMGRHTLHRTDQQVEGRPVLGTELVVKVADQGAVMWGAQCFPNASWPQELVLLEASDVLEAATAGLSLQGVSTEMGSEALIPYMQRSTERRNVTFRPARSIQVSGTSPDGIPVQYATWIDLETGEVLERINQVHHIGDHKDGEKKNPLPSHGASRIDANAELSGYRNGAPHAAF